MKKIIIFLFFLFSFCTLLAQPYGNEWINYSQNYFKVKVTKTGAHKISYSTLSAAGFPVASINPKNIQIFGRGLEIPIHIEGEGDNAFNLTDYIEFYAERNDGWFDTKMYDLPQNHLNPYYSLINDTATYFITWNSSVNNKRFIIETDVAYGAYATENYFLKESISYGADVYLEGYQNQYGTTDPEPTAAEGYSYGYFAKGGFFDISLSTKNIYASGPAASLKTSVAAASYDNSFAEDNKLRIKIQNSGVILADDPPFDGYQELMKWYSLSGISLGSLSTTSTQIRYESINLGSANGGHMSVPFASLTYPHTFDMEGAVDFLVQLPINLASKSTLSFTNFTTSTTVRFYDLTNARRMTAQNISGAYKVVSQNFGSTKNGYLFSDEQITNITEIKPVTPSQKFVNYFSFGSTTDFIILTGKLLTAKANEYAAYRNSKGFSSLVVDVDDLYDQFGFGIVKHPLSIRNFAEYVVDKWLATPKGFFIIGKGLEPKLFRGNTANHLICIVPTMGFPGTDGLLMARINNLVYTPAIPYGRIAAQNATDVNNYLDKVKSYESQAPALWMKEVLHFGGGAVVNEQNLIKSYLENHEQIIEGAHYGANVTSFYKTSSEPVQITTSDQLKSKIETGVSIMNFFGHASGAGFDQNIDDPSVYNWGGRYPIIIANSCYIGNIHVTSASQSNYNERFVLGQNIGAVGFLSQTGTGYIGMLGHYTAKMYTKISKDNYGESIGKCQQETVREVQSEDFFVKGACLEISLHGDPVLKFNVQTKPDYSVTANDVSFTPNNLSTDIDSFDVNIAISNGGKALDEELTVEIKRFFPTSSNPITYLKVMPAPHFKETLVVRLPIDNVNGIGFNEIEVKVDEPNDFDELREDNNTVKVRFFIRSDDINPIYPYKYAVIPSNKVTLVATTGDPFAEANSYYFEMDKTDLFNSSFKKTKTVNQIGGVLKFSPDVVLEDSTVYFWRVSKVPTAGEEIKWKESSFQYIKDKQGWGQAHFFQYKNNTYDFVNYDRTDLKFKFNKNYKKIRIQTYVNFSGKAQEYGTMYSLDNSVEDYGGCGNPSIIVAVIDPQTLIPWGTSVYNPTTNTTYNPTHVFNNSRCRNRIEQYFVFPTQSATAMAGLADMLNNKIPTGYYIAAYSFGVGNFPNWADMSARTAFENLGANFTGLADNMGWTFFTRKGDLAKTKQVVGGPANVLVSLDDTIVSDWNFGKVTSEIVGPALQWKEFIWKPFASESPSYDSTRATIIGIKPSGDEVVLFPSITPATVSTSLAGISVLDYPLLKLQMYTKDDTSKTPSQLRRWHVLYTEVPEAAVAPNLFSRRPTLKVNEGEIVSFATAIENISNQPMDSMLVKYWIEDENRNIKILKVQYLDSLRVGDTLNTSIDFSTGNLPGLNSLWLEANPKNTATGNYDQPEQYHYNNFARFDINVLPDKTNPILDVTFDGTHIMDGDIVSAKPIITMQLNDDNKYKALSDTSLFAVYLKYPNQDVSKRIYFNTDAVEVMKFTAATLPANKAKIEYNPILTTDGTYELQVQGRDVSNNKSGDFDYKVKFEVINKSTITQVLNYPNPFSTSTRFVFTLTGSQIPSYMKIQILTVTGKVVREITESELGQIRIGRNITEYAWDGRDEFGDPLANGIYLYKVFSRINGESIEKRETSADQYFTKEFGKMYLMR